MSCTEASRTDHDSPDPRAAASPRFVLVVMCVGYFLQGRSALAAGVALLPLFLPLTVLPRSLGGSPPGSTRSG